MNNIYNITNCKRETHNMRISRARVNLTTLTTPKISRLKQAARNKLRYLQNKAIRAGFGLSLETLYRAQKRIYEMECVEQYEDFVEDTERCHKFLRIAIKEQRSNCYFYKRHYE